MSEFGDLVVSVKIRRRESETCIARFGRSRNGEEIVSRKIRVQGEQFGLGAAWGALSDSQSCLSECVSRSDEFRRRCVCGDALIWDADIVGSVDYCIDVGLGIVELYGDRGIVVEAPIDTGERVE